MCRSVSQCVAVCCSVLNTELEYVQQQVVAVRGSVLHCVGVFCSVLQYVAVCGSVLK